MKKFLSMIAVASLLTSVFAMSGECRIIGGNTAETTETPTEVETTVETPAEPAGDHIELKDYFDGEYSALAAAVPGLSYGYNEAFTGYGYADDYNTYVSTKDSIVNSISVTGTNSKLFGIYIGMSSDDAMTLLKGRGYDVDESSDNNYFVYSTVTGYCYISVDYEDGVVTGVSCGWDDEHAAPEKTYGDLADYLAKPVADLMEAVPEIAENYNEGYSGSAYTEGFTLWVSLTDHLVGAMSVEKGDYSLFGLYAGMTAEEALNTLKALGYEVDSDTEGNYFVYSSSTGSCYISVDYTDGVVTEIMIG